VFAGDMLLFGGQLQVFVPETGFDSESDIRRLFEAGQDTLSNPLQLDAVFAVGDRVSYGYAAPSGRILVPIFGGPFSLGATAGASCRHDQPACLARKLIRSERWLSVGEGDVSTAAEPIAKARGAALGEVQGTVRWAHSGRAASGARVFLIRDPRAAPCEGDCARRCPDLSSVDDRAIQEWDTRELFAAHRCRSRGPIYLDGTAGVVSFAIADPGTDKIADGGFRIAAPPGRYLLVAQDNLRSTSRPVPVELQTGAPRSAALWLQEPGRLEIEIRDEQGALTAGRITAGRCFPEGGCRGDEDCAPGAQCIEGGCAACARQALFPLELGGPRFADGVLTYAETGTGRATLALPPGDFDLIFSRGPHSSIDRQQVSITGDRTSRAVGRVRRMVDRRGWSAADFHVHAEASLDSGMPLGDRVTSFLAAEIDFLSSSDHDVLTRYDPLIEQLGAKARLGAQVGAEVTTQEIGHFIGYPLHYRLWSDDQTRVLGNGAPDWRELTPTEIFAAIRAAKDPAAGDVIVEVPHPYTYFDFYGLDVVDLEPTGSPISLFNPLLQSEQFSGDFDAMELINGKNYDLIRRPTVGELRFYSQGLDRLNGELAAGAIDQLTYRRLAYLLSTETVRRMLHRTPEEQAAALSGRGAELACRCGSDGDCAPGLACDPSTLSCVERGAVTATAAQPPDAAVCRSLRGVIDDWFNMLNRGVRRTGVGGSDTHGGYGDQPGLPLTLLETGAVTPPYLGSAEVAAAIRAGKVVVSNGPMIHFGIDGAKIGDTLAAAPGQEVTLSIRVEDAGWSDLDRIEVYRNGELIHWLVSCRRTRPGDPAEPHDHPCIPAERETARVLEAAIPDRPERDAWYVVIAMGLDGRTQAPVFSSGTLSRFGTFEVAQRIYEIIPLLRGLKTPRFPTLFPAFPLAITNPIWVDLGGDGWSPPRPPPSWCVPGRDMECER
jgi:hypothetical protein